MSELMAIQQEVARAILDGQASLDALIKSDAGLPASLRLGIYTDAYMLRLEEALRGNYPKLHLLLGDEEFMVLTRSYVSEQPSRSSSIRWLGESLPGYLASRAPWCEMPIFAELAHFEWALGCCFDAADGQALPINVLFALKEDDWPSLQISFHPALQAQAHAWNTVAIWRALDQDLVPPSPSEMVSGWALWRAELQPHYRSLALDEMALLQALQVGQPFAQACEVLLCWHTEQAAPAQAGAYLGQWLRDGWVVGLTG